MSPPSSTTAAEAGRLSSTNEFDFLSREDSDNVKFAASGDSKRDIFVFGEVFLEVLYTDFGGVLGPTDHPPPLVFLLMTRLSLAS